MTNEELAKAIFHTVLRDLTDRRGIRQSPLSEMFDIMRSPDPDDADDNELVEPALECEEKNVKAIAALLAQHRPQFQ